jgi:hypothetical protein
MKRAVYAYPLNVILAYHSLIGHAFVTSGRSHDNDGREVSEVWVAQDFGAIISSADWGSYVCR